MTEKETETARRFRLDLGEDTPLDAPAVGASSRELKETMSQFATGGAIGLDIVGRVLWVGVAVMAVFSLLYFVYARYTSTGISAIQICQLAAESLTMAVIPYVIARAWDEVFRRGRFDAKIL